jgi:hypothetical protein
MKHRLHIAVVLLFTLTCLRAGAEVVATKEKTFSVKYKDEAVERYQATWKADVTTTVKEEGGSPVPYQGSVDKFRCTWTIAVTIERAVALATRLGPSFPLPGMSRTFKDDSQGKGGDYLVTGTRNESCKASAAERDGAIAAAKNNVRGLFERLTEADLETMKQEIRSKADAVTITVQ